jgi:4-amino-4-deoxy-L-arabinose transferase-like glycosyltransferase
METALKVPERMEADAQAERLTGFLTRLIRGRLDDPLWVRPALIAVLAATAVLYLWDLSASGWANAYYSAAVQAMSVSWKAFFFGSLDAANAITVDKTLGSLWLMALSVRLFGLSSWSILAPQALAGVLTSGLVYLSVRRVLTPAAGLIAAGVSALTPVAVLMFRFNNPDALLVLLMVAAAYAVLRAQEQAQTRWLVLAGVLVGFGFLAKMLQVLLFVPAFTLAYLVAAPTTLWRRLWQGVLAGVAALVAGGWWVAVVELWPVESRPYIGGSQTNSVLNLMFGYNGLGRINGNEVGSVVAGGGQGNAGMWGQTGWARMFSNDVGSQVSWLIPAALLFLLAGLWWTRRAARTDSLRASYLLWGGWLVGTGLVFSFMQGIFHAYYTVALAPAIGILVGMGFVQAWQRRHSLLARAVLSGAVALTAGWSWFMLSWTPDWQPWLRPLILLLGALVALAILGLQRIPRLVAIGVVSLALGVSLAGSTAYAIDTAATPHTGAIPGAGPAGGMGNRFGRSGPAPGFPGGANGAVPPGGSFANRRPSFPDGANDGSLGDGGFTNRGPGFQAAMPAFGGAGGAGSLLDASEPGADLVNLLLQDSDQYTWVAACVGANSAAGFQLATEEPVMSIGGFNGTDPWPSLETFQELVARGEIHYFIAGGRGFGISNTAQQISAWVTANFQVTTINGVSVYDLTGLV